MSHCRWPLAILLLLITGCATATPTPTPQEVPTYPRTEPGQFWAPDRPADLPPLAFETLPPEHGVYLERPAIETYAKPDRMPEAPAQQAVYLLGAYPAGDEERFRQEVRLEHPDCTFTPAYSLLTCSPTDSPTGSTAQVDSDTRARERLKALLAPILADDLAVLSVWSARDGQEWHSTANQLVGGLPVLNDKPLQAHLNRDGQLIYVLARRRPLMARSLYPLRTPEDAWQRLTEGKGFAIPILGYEAPTGPHFEARRAALAYVVTHANTPREIMQPYYVFWNEKGQALFVPAVADPHITWPLITRQTGESLPAPPA